MIKLISSTTGYLRMLLALFLIIQSPAGAGQLKPGERLEYTFSYQGIFTGFISIKIAHAEFAIQPTVVVINGQKTYLGSMELSTESFGMAEMFYPIRYRYRSWFEPDQQTPLLVTEYLKTDEVSEELLWFDRENQQGYRYVKRETPKEGGAAPPDFLLDKAGVRQSDRSLMVNSHQKSFNDNEVWDYLSMLHHLRFLELKPGQVINLPLYNGKEVKRYRVGVAKGKLEEAGWNRSAYELSLTELRKGKDTEGMTTRIWVSDDDERLPLRFYTKLAFGAVDGILETGRPLAAKRAGFSKSSLD